MSLYNKTLGNMLRNGESRLLKAALFALAAAGFAAPQPGECQEFCVWGRVDHHALTNLSSNMMANWVFASLHSRGGIFHSPAT